MRSLLLATRFPGGRRSGRKAVLDTIMRSLLALGHEVEIGVIANAQGDPMPPGLEAVPIHRFDRPSLPRIAWNVATGFLPGHVTLNECLYFSPRLRREVSDLIATAGYDLVVADTLRVVELVTGTIPPLVVDLDDLLSTRYADIEAAGSSPEALLGYYGTSLPSVVVGPASLLARRALRREAVVVRRREIEIARTAAAVSLVGEPEAAELSRRAGVPVACLPMAIDVPEQIAPVARNSGDRFACLGGMDFQANLLSLDWFASDVLPSIRNRRPDFHLEMIGYCPDSVRERLTRPGLSFAGYAADLPAKLRGYRGFVAPITTGTGVKTKVLDAMAVGLPVVATPLGVSGLNVHDGTEFLLARDPSEFATAIGRLSERPGEATEIGLAGRELVRGSFAPAVIASRWRELIAGLGPGPTRNSTDRR